MLPFVLHPPFSTVAQFAPVAELSKLYVMDMFRIDIDSLAETIPDNKTEEKNTNSII